MDEQRLDLQMENFEYYNVMNVMWKCERERERAYGVAAAVWRWGEETCRIL